MKSLFIEYQLAHIENINKSGGKGITKFTSIEDIRCHDLFISNHRNSIFSFDEA